MQNREDAPRIAFEKSVLPNGLQLILHLDRKLPVVHVNQWFHVGSKNERRGRTGFAHLFEHIMFQGSKNAPDDYFAFIERAGANLREGGVNGTTSADRTNYFATVPSGNLEFVLWVESDRLATLADALTQEKLDNQREVVRNERRQSYENQPYGRALNLITEALHPADHPYSWPVIGSHEDLQAATLDDVKDFFRRYYAPNNLTLVIAGDFDPDAARALVTKYFGGIPAGAALERPGRYIPVLHGQKSIRVMDRVPQERVYIAWPSVSFFEPEEADLDVASLILSDGLSSRLNRRMVYDEQLASDVSSFNWASEISGAFAVVATARPGVPLGALEKAIDEEILRLADEGPTEAEVMRAKTKWEYEFVTGLERIGGFGGKADRLAQYNTFLGDPGRFDDDVARYRGVTGESVQRAIGQWVANSNRVVVRFHPEQSRRGSADGLDRAQVPPLGVDVPFAAPPVAQTTLSNGTELFVVERRDLPKVAVVMVTRGGAIADPQAREGVAHLVAACIDMGTPSRSSLEIEDALGDLGTGIGAAAAREYSAISLEVLTRNLEPAFAIFADVIRNASFPESEVAREKMIHLDALAQQSNSPNAVAARLRAMLLFGREHPYGRPAQGLPSTVERIGREDLVAFHRDYWKPASSALIMTGDVSLTEARELAERHLGAWTGGPAQPIPVPPAQPATPGTTFLVDRQDAPQTVIVQLLPAPPRTAHDYYALRLVDAVWGGGGFRTRLNLNLREDKGYAYGVFSSLAAFSRAGAWWASGSVQSDKTAESIVEFVKELRGLGGERPITESELNEARDARIRGYSQQFESIARIAQQIAELWSLGLPITELQREIDEVSRLTLADVEAAARRYADPSQAIMLLVGDLSLIGTDGENVVVLDVEGNPVAVAV